MEGGERTRVVRMNVSAKSEKERLVRGATSREAVGLRSGASSREERIDLMKEGKIEEGWESDYWEVERPRVKRWKEGGLGEKGLRRRAT